MNLVNVHSTAIKYLNLLAFLNYECFRIFTKTNTRTILKFHSGPNPRRRPPPLRVIWAIYIIRLLRTFALRNKFGFCALLRFLISSCAGAHLHE